MEDITLEDIKALLGEKANQFTDEELFSDVVKIQYLIELWLNEFERGIFNGKNLFEMLSRNII